MNLIDGSQGEGGGQIFRTSLTLAMCLGQPVTIENIRAGRAKPGLLRQHLTCLKASQAICDAVVEGDYLGSSRVVFKPNKVKPGSYQFAIGSAGSTTLVFQTLYLPLLFADGASELILEGGTHNGLSPSFDFIEQTFLPQLVKMGASIAVDILAYGFNPAGGGKWRALIKPISELGNFTCVSPANGWDWQVSATATTAKLPEHIAGRELARVAEKLSVSPSRLHRRTVRSVGPGNILSVQAHAGGMVETFEVIGERRRSAEKVADRAIGQFQRFASAGVGVAEHLADQLLLPMALGGGGSFTTLNPSEHFTTNVNVIQAFLDRDISVTQLGDESCFVDIAAHD